MPVNKKPDQAPIPAFDDAPSDEALDKAAASFGDVLARRPKVRVRIPLDPLNPHDMAVPVCINGYVYEIRRGQAVDVPDTVADLLAAARYV